MIFESPTFSSQRHHFDHDFKCTIELTQILASANKRFCHTDSNKKPLQPHQCNQNEPKMNLQKLAREQQKEKEKCVHDEMKKFLRAIK